MRDYGGRDAANLDLLLLAGCTAVALIAYAIPGPWAASVVAGLRQTALRPVVALQERAARDRTSRFQLDHIQADHDSLALIVISDSALRAENESLRQDLGLGARLTTPWVGAAVMHRPSPTDGTTLSLDVGSDDGVGQYDPVVTSQGLVGYVWSVSTASSVALTWMHPDFGASVVTAGSGVLGFLQPVNIGTLGHPLLELRGVALSDTLPLGELIYTSGLGGVYPRLIPVGRVVGIEPDPLGYERFYRVAPLVNPGSLGQVIVLTTPQDSTVAIEPPPGGLL